VEMTSEEMAARPKQPKEARRDTSAAVYKKTSNKWWPLFCKAHGWDQKDMMDFLNEDGSPRDGIFRRLFIWMYEQPGMTKGSFKPMLAWAQASLNEQRTKRLLPEMPNYVCQLPGVKNRKAEIYTGHRESHMEHMTDLQAAIEGDIGFSGMDRMVRRCLSHQIPETQGMFTTQTMLELRATHQMAARHDDLRAEVFAHMFARDAKKVGPSGMSMLCSVTNGGKTNKNGNIEYSAVLPHRNPLHCSIFARGCLFIWRFNVMRVQFPVLTDPKDIFRRCTLRQGYDEFNGVTYDSSYKIMKRLYEAEAIVAVKVLHQGRGEMQRFLDDEGVPLDLIRRLCKYIHDDQSDSYLLNPPLAALLAAAGYDDAYI
jgi:hypothetical protein